MPMSRRGRRVHLAILLAALLSVPSSRGGAQCVTSRNYVVISADDAFWAYYGFVQRYLKSKLDAHAIGRAYEDDPGAQDKFDQPPGRQEHLHIQ